MSFSDNIEYLMAHPGTVAVVTWSAEIGSTHAGHKAWIGVLSTALVMLDFTSETFVSAIVGEHSILAETRDGQQCAVVYPTGHPASKVMRRMLRNAAGPKRTMRKPPASAPAAKEVC